MNRQTVANARREAGTAVRFAVVGAVATVVHSASVWLLHTTVALPIFLANVSAFAFAFQVSFLGHARWTFAPLGPDRRAARRRFLLVAASGLGLNTVLLALLLELRWLAPQHAGALAALAVPAWSFLWSRLWAFRPATA